ncbi:MAG: hypothetical protein R3E68_10985 [Burkholderiaceae bacterium]
MPAVATPTCSRPPSVSQYMGKGTNMFKDMKDAPELFNKNVRGILNHPLGPYHIVTYADSGIKELKDVKGRKLFIGPPGGAATVVDLAILEGATGYKPGIDFEQANSTGLPVARRSRTGRWTWRSFRPCCPARRSRSTRCRQEVYAWSASPTRRSRPSR